MQNRKPTEAQVNAVTAKAEDLLRRMELGQWDVIETEIETQQIGDSVEYTVHVRAAPVLNGVSVLYGQPTSFFQDDYKPTYLMTKAEFIFSANGDIIFFDMCSPMDIVETRNTNVQVLPLEELFEKLDSTSLSAMLMPMVFLPDYVIASKSQARSISFAMLIFHRQTIVWAVLAYRKVTIITTISQFWHYTEPRNILERIQARYISITALVKQTRTSHPWYVLTQWTVPLYSSKRLELNRPTSLLIKCKK